MNKIEHTKKQILSSLEQSLGIVSVCCKKVGISRTTFYNYYNADREFAQSVDDIENFVLDFAESQLHKLIGEGNVSAIIFYLKTKGKKRGYVERQEIEVKDLELPPIEYIVIDANNVTETSS